MTKAIPTPESWEAIDVSRLRAWATIDLAALRANFNAARQCNPTCRIAAIVKANGYGHGLVEVAFTLHQCMQPGDCLGVASLEEAVILRRHFADREILLLEGFLDPVELDIIVRNDLQFVLHSLYQLDALQAFLRARPEVHGFTIWLKLNTGMNRLGLSAEDFVRGWDTLQALPGVRHVIAMSHLACADDLDSAITPAQVTAMDAMLERLQTAQAEGKAIEASLAASGGTLAWPEAHYQWLRPGIMLYGGSSILGEDGTDLGLRPVMTLRSRLIAINTVKKGESIGYGANHICEQDKRVGVVSIGYGDGYPRRMPDGTPVLVVTARGAAGTGAAGHRQCQLIGRVSMDMLTIDLSNADEAAIGDEVILWGEGLPADRIARRCGTIAYELFCQVTRRVHYLYR